MLTRYLTGTPLVQAVLAVNLANQKGSEGTLGRTFKQEAERYAKVKPGFEVVNFDFHHECKGMRYDRCAPQFYIIAEPNRSLAWALQMFTLASICVVHASISGTLFAPAFLM